jgi:hypothetical protein
MKKTSLFLLFSCMVLSSFGQADTLSGNDYLRKSRNQRVGAFVLIGTGALSCTIGFSQAMNHLFDNNNKGEAMMIAGLSLAVASIPFFIGAGKNKRKAVAVTGVLKMEQSSLPHGAIVVNHSYPVIAVRLRL